MVRHENTSKNTHNVVFELLRSDPSCRSVLDLPCGAGHFSRRCRDAGLQVHAGDCNPPTDMEGVQLATCDMNRELPFAGAALDAVACIDGIEHLERPFDFVRECRRIIRPGGALVLSTPNISALRSRMRWLLTGFHNKCKVPLDESHPNPLHHIGMISFPELRYLLHTNGFLITAVRANRVKPVSWAYAPLWPLSRLMTALELAREEDDPAQRARNRDIQRSMHGAAVFFGETLIVRAQRQP